MTASASVACCSSSARCAPSSSACRRTRVQAMWERSPSRMIIITAMPILAASASMPMKSPSAISDIAELQLAVEAAQDHDFRQCAEDLLGLQPRHLLVHLAPDHQPGGAAARERRIRRAGAAENLMHLGPNGFHKPAGFARTRQAQFVYDHTTGVAELDLAGDHPVMDALALCELQFQPGLLLVEPGIVDAYLRRPVAHFVGLDDQPVELE